MINLLKQALETVLNHKQMGKLSPSDFNTLLAKNIWNIYANIFADMRKLSYRKMRFQDTPNYGDESFYLKQAQEYYIAEKTISFNQAKCDLTQNVEDYFLFNDLFTNNANVSKVDLSQFNSISRLPEFTPTNCQPICTLNGGILKISPSTIKNADLVYFRKPKTPKYTYEVIGETEVFNPSSPDFQDIDMHPIMLEAIYIEMLMDYGINLKDEFAIQGTNLLKQNEQINKQ